MRQKVKAFIMNFFCIKGSWKWAKIKMNDGFMIRSTEWVGSLKFRSHPVTNIFEINFSNKESEERWVVAATNLKQDLYRQVTSYELAKWDKDYKILMYNSLELCRN
ncbi:hypothetical protein [Ferruginibacter sp.]|uniref:hypothetical protein n=1 Tax=Ferruginibacter sp. TaxID=1940288 RepID=UPI00374D8985